MGGAGGEKKQGAKQQERTIWSQWDPRARRESLESPKLPVVRGTCKAGPGHFS